MKTNSKQPSFYFYRYDSAVRYHLTKQLELKGWHKAPDHSSSCFNDSNLTLNDEISTILEYKHLLNRLVKRFCPEVMPLTYNINDANFQSVLQYISNTHYSRADKDSKSTLDLQWILKPSTLNNGDHIKVFPNVEAIAEHYINSKRMGGEHVIQRYVSNPKLIDGKKFTYRLPVIFTNYDGVYIYHQGYVNISGQNYTPASNFDNRKIHLTNYILDGELANITQRSTINVAGFDDTFLKMSETVRKIVKAMLLVSPNYLKTSTTKIYEVFGFDFIQDDNDNIYLIEINQGPDAPMNDDHCLKQELWDPFWSDVTSLFTLPIGLDSKINLDKHPRFIKLLPAMGFGHKIWNKLQRSWLQYKAG